MSGLIRVVGLPGAGKTTLREALSDALSLPGFDIAACGRRSDPAGRWATLAATVDDHPRAIVESSGWTPQEQAFYATRPHVTVVVKAPPQVRRSRLAGRQEAEEDRTYLSRLMRYAETTVEGIPWDGTAAIGGPAFAALVARLEA